MQKNSRITRAGIVALAALLSLSGCGVVAGASPAPSAEPETSSSPDAAADSDVTDTADADADADAGSAGSDLTFDAGQTLSSTESPQLGDPFVGHPGWAVRSEDDGQGSWSYTTADTLCTLIFMQQAIDGGAIVEGDDEATTDNYLALVLKTTPEKIAGLAMTGTFKNGLHASAVVESRVVTGTDTDGYEWMLAGRAFANPMTGLYAYVSCTPDADSTAVFTDVVDHVSIFPSLG